MNTPRLIFRNLGNGKFEELIEDAGPGIAAPHSSRGCAFGDFDNDGDMDVLIVNLNEPPSLLRNDVSGTNHWLKVKLVGAKSNRSAIGATVTARYGGKVQAQALTQPVELLLGQRSAAALRSGAAEVVDLEIRWPNGNREALSKVPADRFVVVREGEGIVSPYFEASRMILTKSSRATLPAPGVEGSAADVALAAMAINSSARLRFPARR